MSKDGKARPEEGAGGLDFEAEFAAGIAAGLGQSEGGRGVEPEDGEAAGAGGGEAAGAGDGEAAGAGDGEAAGAGDGEAAGAGDGEAAGAGDGEAAGAGDGEAAEPGEFDDESPDPARWSRGKLLRDRNTQVGRVRSMQRREPEPGPDRPARPAETAGVADLTEKQREDVAGVLKYLEDDPLAGEIKDLLLEESRAGSRLRDLAAKFEPPIVAAEAGRIAQRRQTEAGREEAAARRQAEHLENIAAQHPDVVQTMLDKENPDRFEDLRADVLSYVYGLPAEKRREALAVMRDGSAAQTNKLLADYKDHKARAGGSGSRPRDAKPKPTAQQRRDAQAAAAVPSKGPSFVPRGAPDPDDLESGIKRGLQDLGSSS